MKLIQNALLYDGTGTAPVRGDILFDSHICEIGRITPKPGMEVMDAEGKILCPGFIDIHRHPDIAVLCDEDFGEIELSQGITTTIAGNCGLAPVPCCEANREEQYDYIEPCLGRFPPEIHPDTHEEYCTLLKNKGLPLNMGLLAGAGAVKAAVRGYKPGRFTAAELARAKELVTQAMDSGAFGLSMGIMYLPECYSSLEEMTALAKAAGRTGGVLTTHMRGEGDTLVSSVREVLSIAQKAEMPLHISHFKATGVKNWRKNIFEAIERIEEARNHGQKVTVDVYPYDAGSTTLTSLLPPTVQKETLSETLRCLSRETGRERLRKEIYRTHDSWENMVLSIGWERVVICSVSTKENAELTGKSLAEAARLRQYDEPADLLCDLLIQESGKVTVLLRSMSPEDVETVLRLPYAAVISDALYGNKKHAHPRLYGAFPKVIETYVKERSVLSLQEAIRKMTSFPAEIMGIEERGRLKTGYRADLVLFDTEHIEARSVYEKPAQLSAGMDAVFIGGKVVWENNRLLPGKPGEIIKRQKEKS